MPGTPNGKAMKDKFLKLNSSKIYRHMSNNELQNLVQGKFFDKNADREIKRREKKHMKKGV